MKMEKVSLKVWVNGNKLMLNNLSDEGLFSFFDVGIGIYWMEGTHEVQFKCKHY